MFQSQIDDMRESVIRMSLRPVKPQVLLIKRDHAKYLGVKWLPPSRKKKPPRPELPQGVRMEMVTVEYIDLYRALQKDPKGIDVLDPLVSRKQNGKTPTWRQGN